MNWKNENRILTSFRRNLLLFLTSEKIFEMKNSSVPNIKICHGNDKKLKVKIADKTKRQFIYILATILFFWPDMVFIIVMTYLLTCEFKVENDNSRKYF